MKKFYPDRLQNVLNHLDWTQKQLAEKSKVDPLSISRWMNKNALPTIRSLNKVAKATGCNLGYLIGEEDVLALRSPGHLGIFLGDEVIVRGDLSAEMKKGFAGAKPETKTLGGEDDLQGGWSHQMKEEDWALLGKAHDVLTSDTPYRVALVANIEAFYHALGKESELNDTKKYLKEQYDRVKELEQKYNNLLERFDNIEKKAVKEK